MSEIAKSVDLIVRSSIRADPVYVEKLKEKSNITVHLPAHISSVHGDKFLTGVTLKKENDVDQDLILDGVFIEIGWLPNTDMLNGFVEMNDKKEIVIDINCHTSVEGSLRPET